VLWSANCCYTFFQLCCFAWRVHTKILTTPLHGDKNLLITWQLVRNTGTSLVELTAVGEDEEDDYDKGYVSAPSSLQKGDIRTSDDSIENGNNNNGGEEFDDEFEHIELSSVDNTGKNVNNNAAIII